MCAKFDYSSLNRSRDIIGPKIKLVTFTWPWRRPFYGSFVVSILGLGI